MQKVTITLIALLTTLSRGYSQAGTLDPTFSSSGYTITNLGTGEQIKAMVLQPDGKIVVAGSIQNATVDFLVARYNADGSIDNTFGSSGFVTTSIGTAADAASALAIQPDGKIIAAGYSNSAATGNDFALVRYNTDGSLDATFGSGGKVTTAINSSSDNINAIALQPDGKIVAVGNAFATRNSMGFARYNANGSLDATFGTGGIGVVTTGGRLYVYAVAIQPDGKLLVGGNQIISGGTYSQLLVWRYNVPALTIDGTWNVSGNGNYDPSTMTDNIYSIGLQSDGKVVVGGVTNNRFLVARYNTNGTFDASFGTTTSGVTITPLSGGITVPYSMDMQSDGKIVLAGFTSGSNPLFAVVRYTATGALDPAFGSGGTTTASLGTTNAQGQAVKVYYDRIYVAGQVGSSPNTDVALAAFKSDLAPLPLVFLSFNANLVDNEAHLEWETANEVNTAEFAIERSSDGLLYKTAGTIPTHNTPGKHTYTFTDDIGYGVNSKKLFYRLKQIDLDGQFTYSGIVNLNLPVTGTIVKLFPNPVADKATLLMSTSAEESITYRIIDNRGVILSKTTIGILPGDNSIVVNTRTLKAGVYILAINMGGTQKQIRFIKR